MILLLGATGYTGRRVLRRLLKAGERVRCLVRKPEDVQRVRAAGGDVVVGDLDDPGMGDAFVGASAVVNAAHIRYARAVVDACYRHGVRRVVVYSSTWRFSRFPTPEIEAIIEGERVHSESALDTTILRPTMIYGPGNDRNISRLRAHIRRLRVFPVFGDGESLVQPVHVEDAADAVDAVLRRTGTHGKAYELAGGEAISYGTMVDRIAEAEGHTVLKIYVPLFAGLPLVRLYGIVSAHPSVTPVQVRRMREDRAFDISAAVGDFGYHPRTFVDGLRDVLVTEQRAGEPS